MSSGNPPGRAPGQLVRAALRKARATLAGPEPLRFEDPLSDALSWLHKHTLPQQGIAVSSAAGAPAYAEVTGYLIPTLLDWGEHELAGAYAH